jgi:hypothetical protein
MGIIIIIYQAETLSSLTQAKFLHNRVTTSFQSMVHGWLVGSPLASGVCVGWWEGVDEKEEEEEAGGAQKEKPKNRHHPAFFPRLSQYPKCGIFWKGKTPPTGFQLVFFLVSLHFQGPFLQLGTAMRGFGHWIQTQGLAIV